MKHTAFFGDGEKTFALTPDLILELERRTGSGIGAIYARCMTGQFQLADLMETIRLGLIGGGTSPKEALALVDTYARPTPIRESYVLASDILQVLYRGYIDTPAPDTQDDLRQAATTGDLAAAIHAAYAEDTPE